MVARPKRPKAKAEGVAGRRDDQVAAGEPAAAPLHADKAEAHAPPRREGASGREGAACRPEAILTKVRQQWPWGPIAWAFGVSVVAFIASALIVRML